MNRVELSDLVALEEPARDSALLRREFDPAPTNTLIRVFMMDLWCYTPYYDRYLFESLTNEGVAVTLGAVRPYQDPDYFLKHSLRNDPGLLDLIAGLGISNNALRRVLMLGESCLNMMALVVRWIFSKPHIVHVQWVPTVRKLPFEIWFMKLVKCLGIKLVYTVHNVLPHDSGQRFFPLFRRIYADMDALICHTNEAKERLTREFLIPADRIWTIPHGPLLHDAESRSSETAKDQLCIPRAETVVLWQGIIRSYKGLDFLLDAWTQARDRVQGARLLIAGTGETELLASISQRVDRLGLSESVRLDFKFIPDKELATYYQAADVLVYPYREVTASGALMTAQAFGKAIVATSLPAFEEALRDGETALLVSYGDVDGLADALIRLVLDRKERERLGSALAASSKSENSWSRIATETHRCYVSLLQNSELQRALP